MVLGILMIGTFMAILDTSIVNVALPHMMSAFGVNRDQIEWVSTGFMLASAVTMPLIGWLSDRLSYERLYLISLFIFTAGSALCAFAWSYHTLVGFRIIQAVGGGAIQPVGMALVADLFEPEERGKALGIWGTGIMLGPAIGPTLGGYLTDWFNWRSIFSVNLPVGAAALVFGVIIMNLRADRKRERHSFDLLGYGFLSLFLIASLLALSNGERLGWTSNYILICTALSVIGLVMFLAIELSVREPLLDLGLFKHRNYSISMLLSIFRSIGLFGGVFLLPIFLQNLVGYTTVQTGLWMMPGALAVGLVMPLAGQMTDRYHPRWLVFFGIIVTGVSMLMFGYLDPKSGALMLLGPQIIRGVGLAFMMAPLMTAALNAVPQEDIATASSFLNITSRVGGAFGIAILNTFVTHMATSHALHLSEKLSLQSETFKRLVLWLQHYAAGTLASSQQGIVGLAAKVIAFRAQVLAFDNGFVFGGLILLIGGIPLSLLLAHSRSTSDQREPVTVPE